MTKDEALRMALKSLEFYYDLWKEKVDAQTITAIREALAQSEQEPVAMRYDFDGYGYSYIDNGSGSNWREKIKNAEPLYTAPPQRKPEQEPVAWELRAGKTDRVLIEITNNPQRAHDWKASLEEVVPLYTSPPQSFTYEQVKAHIQAALLSSSMPQLQTFTGENPFPPQRKTLTDELYNELLFAVSKKHQNETRHQTALRYILQAEENKEQAAKSVKGE